MCVCVWGGGCFVQVAIFSLQLCFKTLSSQDLRIPTLVSSRISEQGQK